MIHIRHGRPIRGISHFVVKDFDLYGNPLYERRAESEEKRNVNKALTDVHVEGWRQRHPSMYEEDPEYHESHHDDDAVI